ncbi:nitrate ABC transporter inner membrane subunit [Moraxella macacae 0408225]|uniref:Nitrate ABC transporter inner membrane subunit n=1 Tax=Moraxella macacae 0408225 TaxID=1230338 RepID=L2F6E9_9GAMM|nr:nitrate ABC transporter permease [Moraxella macacae]ELA08629.1 nitrate ABC transporter inner membrane subunit [Moraxella macacae 0408225]
MIKSTATKVKGYILSLLIVFVGLGFWQFTTLPTQIHAPTDPLKLEYSVLMGDLPEGIQPGAIVVSQKSEFPSPGDFANLAINHLSAPFYDKGLNDKGIGIQLGYSIGRVLLGFCLAVIVAIPLGFLVGMSAVLNQALMPFVQILKPISPLAWMPIALYTIKDSNASGIFVIFICSMWPMLTSTAFGVANVRKEWRNVAKTLELSNLQTATKIILPAAAPTIVTGMKISMGIAWLVIVAAEMLVGSTGIGYFVWNQWNNLSIGNVVFAVLMIGLVGMMLEMLFERLQKMVSYVE